MKKDTRTYITVHDGMPEHPKIRPLSDKAFRTIMELWCWCSRNRNDGEMSLAAFKTWGTPRARQELLDQELVEPLGDDHVKVHDYTSHQRSRAEIEALSETRSRVGKMGGRPPKSQATENQIANKDSAKKTQLHLQKKIDITNPPETSYERSSTSEDDPVHNPLIEKIVTAVHDGGVDIHPLVVPDIIAFIDERRGSRSGPVKVPERYYPTTIRHSWPEVEQFIYEKGLVS